MSDGETLLNELRVASAHTESAAANYQHWRARRDALIVQAAALSVPKVAITAQAGITRAMVDRIIKRDTAAT